MDLTKSRMTPLYSTWSSWGEFIASLKPYLPEWPAYMVTKLKADEEGLLDQDPYPLRYSNRPERMRCEETWLVATMHKKEVVWSAIRVEAAKYPVSMIDGRRGDDEYPGRPGFVARKWQALAAIEELTGVKRA